MLFEQDLLFFHATTAYGFTTGEFVNLSGATATSTSTVINLGNPRDLGIGDGQDTPNWVAVIGTGLTSSSSSMLVNLQFQGSTNSTAWTTYMETTPASTASYVAGAYFNFRVPRRPNAVSLPQYYQLVVNVTGTGGVPTISTGTILAGIVLVPSEGLTIGQYGAGFSVS